MPSNARLVVSAMTIASAASVPVQQVTVAGALPGNTSHAADTEQFTKLEARIRQEYVAAHPVSIKELLGPEAAKLLKENQVPVESRFSAEMTRAVLGQMVVQPDPMKRPSYWTERAFTLLTLLPFGNKIQEAVDASRSKTRQSDTSASDKLARQNLENFKKIVAVYGEPGAANRFDSATPAHKIQMFLGAFKVYLNEDLAFPNPYTVWVLDDDDDTDDEHPERPHYSHSILNHLAGLGNPDDYGWESYSREHKTEVLHKAFLHLIDVADQIIQTNDEAEIYGFAKLVGLDIIRSGDEVTGFYDPVYNQHYTYRHLVLNVFGNETLSQLDRKTDRNEKAATQRAAFIMYFLLQRVVAGALVG